MAFAVVLIGFAVLVLGCSLRLVPPRHIALVTRFGRRTGEVKTEGLRFFLFYPHVSGAILVSLDRHVHSISFPMVLSRDSAQIRFEITVAWTPSPSHICAYLDNNEVGGTEAALDGIFKDRLRSWAAATDWRDITSTLVTAFFVTGLSAAKPSPQIVEQLQSCSASLTVPSLGIDLNRLNVTSFLPSDKLAEAVQEDVIRKEKGKADERELQNAINYIRKVMTDLGCNRDEAKEFIQLEHGKISKQILELALRQI